MTAALKFVPPRVPLTDPTSGIITREWFLFLQGVFSRIGGSTGSSITEVEASMFEDAGSGETNAALFAVEQAQAQRPTFELAAIYADQAPAQAPTAEFGVLLAVEQSQAQAPTQLVDLAQVVLTLEAALMEQRDQLAELVKDIQAIRQGSLL